MMHPKAVGLLAVLVIAATAWRIQQARESLWLDELHSAWCAGGDLPEVAPRAAIGNQSPLYFWLLWGQTQLYSQSELVLRGPSLIAGVLTLVALYWLVARTLRSPWLGLLAAWLYALIPLADFYATEARPYALVTLIAVLHVAIFAALCRQPTWQKRALFVLGAALLFHLHYTAALLLPAELAFWLVAAGCRLMPIRYSSRQMTWDLVFIGLAWMPAAGLIGVILGRRQNWEAFVPQRPLWEIFELLPWSAAALVVLGLLPFDRYLAGRRRQPGVVTRNQLRLRRAAALGLCWLLVPLLAAWAATWTDAARLLFPRYLVASMPAAVLLAVTCVRFAPWQWSQVAAGSLLAGAALWMSLVSQPARRGEDWRGAIEWLNEQLAEREFPVLVMSDLIEDQGLRASPDERLKHYCLFPVTSLYRVNLPQSELVPLPSRGHGILTSEQCEMVRSRGGAWLIVRTKELETANTIGREVGKELSSDAPDDRVWRLAANHRGEGVHSVLLLPRLPTPDP